MTMATKPPTMGGKKTNAPPTMCGGLIRIAELFRNENVGSGSSSKKLCAIIIGIDAAGTRSCPWDYGNRRRWESNQLVWLVGIGASHE